MAYLFEDLDEEVRGRMLAEFEADVEDGLVYFSSVVDRSRSAEYMDAHRQAFLSGNPETFATKLAASDMFLPTQSNGHRVNVTSASQRLAGGQFNAYFIRALAAKAIDLGFGLEVYRARESSSRRSSSDALIGTSLSPEDLLQDLRAQSTDPGGFSVLPEVSSGLSVKLR